ncbi:hypothetical protein [uncultured Campylobacter sp.]|nr:hypothetical protein [uncultured Campylobacter sp.]
MVRKALPYLLIIIALVFIYNGFHKKEYIEVAMGVLFIISSVIAIICKNR